MYLLALLIHACFVCSAVDVKINISNLVCGYLLEGVKRGTSNLVGVSMLMSISASRVVSMEI